MTADASCRAFALRTLDRFLSRRLGRPRAASRTAWAASAWTARWTIRCSWPAALLDAFEATLDRRYFDAAERTARLCIEKYADPKAAAFSTAPPTPRPWADWTFAASRCRIRPRRAETQSPQWCLTACSPTPAKTLYREHARRLSKPSPASSRSTGSSPRLTAWPRCCIARHPMQILVTGAPGDEAALRLDRAARSSYRFGKAVLRITPELGSGAALPPALAPDGAASDARRAAGIRLRRPDLLSARPGPRKAPGTAREDR